MKPKPRYQSGDRIGGRYQVHKALMGGMGEVYLCLDLEEMIPYALKTFQQRYQSQELHKVFEQEVATWVALEKHPNIVRCHHMDTLDNQPFMVLEWIAGEEGKGADLRGWLRHGPLDLKMALEITLDVVYGLIHAQEKQPGLVHRDLKPENILVAQGPQAKITDFGLAQIVESAGLEVDAPGPPGPPKGGERNDIPPSGGLGGQRQSLVRKGGIAGTPAYMAPEQWRGEALDERTDIYALGCIFYEMLTGHWPFRVDFVPTTPQHFQQWLSAIQTQHENNRAPQLPANLPAGVPELLQRCLAKTPAERTESLAALLASLTTLYRRQFGFPPPAPLPAGEMTIADYGNRGVTYNNLKQHDKALADFNRVLKLDPQDAIAYANRGDTYSDLGQADKALANFNRAIKLDPEFANAYTNRGILYGNLGQANKALADFNRVLKLDPQNAKAYYNRGVFYSDLEQTDKAMADFNRAIELDPQETTAYLNLGALLGNQGQLQEALSYFTRAIELDPQEARAYLNLGILLGNHDQHQEALPYFEKAAQLGDPQGVQYAAMARRALGQEAAPLPGPTQAAFEAFRQADSMEAMGQAVDRVPFMAQADFIAVIEQVIAQQVPPEHRPQFEQRLGWLRQIIKEQKKPSGSGLLGRLLRKRLEKQERNQ